ncbi:hypothetical protein NDU88_002482 [Pleurodeles waltl]|uniref:Uncharacterized protein n=1 Tax=Pleurodeles waltl TaxID=8319 RepID=A0AAV7T2K4_PLEWA|nr:hypothetical protein NDU88_002482 [Pleurodeles waltl]
MHARSPATSEFRVTPLITAVPAVPFTLQGTRTRSLGSNGKPPNALILKAYHQFHTVGAFILKYVRLRCSASLDGERVPLVAFPQYTVAAGIQALRTQVGYGLRCRLFALFPPGDCAAGDALRESFPQCFHAALPVTLGRA